MTEKRLRLLAKNLRTRSDWMHDPTGPNSAASYTVQAALDGIADDIEEVLDASDEEVERRLRRN